MPRQDIWDEHEISIIKKEYKGNAPAIRVQSIIKQQLGKNRSIYAIYHKAQEYNLQVVSRAAFPKAGDVWTAEEDEFLKENRQKRSIYWLSTQMKRSKASINWRCQILKINGDGREGWYTQTEVCNILDIGHIMVNKLIKEGRLKANRRNGEGEYKDWEIREESLYSFITKFPQFLQNRHPDMVQLVDVLTKGDIKYKV